jgi:hypothetical protein
MRADDLLGGQGVPSEVPLPPSGARFPDGADFRIEIPSVEGPAVLACVVQEAEQRGVVVNRVSQGSGAMVLSQRELREMARIGNDAGLEISLFVGPREEWGLGAQSRSADGATLSGGIRGSRQLRFAVEDVLRAVDCGIRGFLVADLGLQRVLSRARAAGQIPAEVVWKISAVIAPSNAATLALLVDIGADTVNLPTDLTLAELAEMRSITDVPLDLYVEAPDAMGGVVRGEQLGDLIEVTAPLYAKFGLRNSRPLYPSGLHLEADAILIAREKVHRAQVALEWMERTGSSAVQSKPGATGLGVPVL